MSGALGFANSVYVPQPTHYLVALGLGVLLCKAKGYQRCGFDFRAFHPQLGLLHGPVIFYQPGKGVTAHLLDIPLCPQCLLPRPVLMFRVLALTHPQGLSSWERLQGDSRQPLITAFMNSAPSILKRRKLRPRIISCLARGVSCHGLWPCKPRDSAAGWDLEHIWTSAPPPAT